MLFFRFVQQLTPSYYMNTTFWQLWWNIIFLAILQRFVTKLMPRNTHTFTLLLFYSNCGIGLCCLLVVYYMSGWVMVKRYSYRFGDGCIWYCACGRVEYDHNMLMFSQLQTVLQVSCIRTVVLHFLWRTSLRLRCWYWLYSNFSPAHILTLTRA